MSPEAEWGFDTALADDVAALARQMDWRVVRIDFYEPEALSFAAAAIHREWYRDAEIRPTRLIVDSFLLMDPLTTLELHALPFWLLFCVEPSADALQRFLDAEGPFDEIDLMLFSHGTESIGLASIERWRALLDKATRSGRFIGVDTARYPRDFATFVQFGRALARMQPRSAVPPAMTLARFETLLRQHGPAYAVHCAELAPKTRVPT
ncbi:hypothetical protein [Paraburkholderia terricola]|uniref:Uncharacterized protein n=1 Tax=Paraburkholderia terricola TaxID=169427 RepID=A0A1M6PLR4_9BURK|nr:MULTISPECIES: hypothetical protein [Paraburkholderia]SDO46929.1 hypothetical protein SAMN05192547_101718 [Paraburkholderia sediminicola]SHK08868.1 hypothetical protein SAMN05192548_101346 [Paraburkholderia terricola]